MNGTPVGVRRRDLLEERLQEGARVRRPPGEGGGLTNVVIQRHQHTLLYKADDNKLFKQRVHSPGGERSGRTSQTVREGKGKGRWRWGRGFGTRRGDKGSPGNIL